MNRVLAPELLMIALTVPGKVLVLELPRVLLTVLGKVLVLELPRGSLTVLGKVLALELFPQLLRAQGFGEFRRGGCGVRKCT